MPSVPQLIQKVSPHLLAGLLLLASAIMRSLELTAPSTGEILETTGAGRSRAFEQRTAIERWLPTLDRGPGRPKKPCEVSASTDDVAAVSQRAMAFVYAHPGCVDAGGSRARYTDDFHRFVLELRADYDQMPLDDFARAVGVPRGTLEDWLRPSAQLPLPLNNEPEQAHADEEVDGVTSARIQAVIDAWSRWNGGFVPFCKHVRHHERIPFGITLIRNILETYGVRVPKRRQGRSPDENAVRNSFETFFPGAQWIGDGTPLVVWIDDQPHGFNLELDVDAYSGGLVGASIRDEEDSAAVIEAYNDGVAATGAAPLALQLDNRLSNHTDDVQSAIGDTIRIRATQGRPQNDGHVEGAFGLFQQTAPALSVNTDTRKGLARQLLTLVFATWARTLNHRPRNDRGCRSRVAIYTEDAPTEEQVKQAKQALQERCRQQELKRQREHARQDPQVRRLLDDAFERLDLADPDRNIRDAIALYPLDAIVAGIATYEAKQRRGSLPAGVDGRYLLGIVRNIARQDEGIAIAEILWDLRQHVHDHALDELAAHRESVELASDSPMKLLAHFADLAMKTRRRIDRFYWLKCAVDLVNRHADADPRIWFLAAARRIHAAQGAPHAERLQAARFLAAKLLPAC